MFSVISGAELVVGMWLHSLIYATTLGLPAMALVYDPKNSAFMDSINQPDWVNVETMTTDEAASAFSRIMAELDQRKEQLQQTNKVLKETAEKNALYAIELLNK